MTVVPQTEWDELDGKLSGLCKIARAAGCGGLILRKQASLSWLLGGRSHVPNTLDAACFDVLLDVATRELTIVVNAIEAPRLQATELKGLTARFHVVQWWEDRGGALPSGDDIGSDASIPARINLSEDIAALRRRFTPLQQTRLQQVSTDAARAATRAALQLTPTMTEYQAAGAFAQEFLADGMDPIVLLVAGADRMARDRHPLPTTAVLGSRGMLVCCARRHGVVASVTRIATFQPLTSAEKDGYSRLLQVESDFLDATRPGASLGDAFSSGVAGYAAHGFDPDEWHRHHQGGLSGWEPREFPARMDSSQVLTAGNVVAWNPSGDGWKVEDTCLVTADGVEPLVHDPAWPQLVVGDRVRPGILQL